MAQITIREPLWSEITGLVRRKGKSPTAVAEKALREFLERQEAEELLARSDRIARKARFKLADTEKLIQTFRERRKSM